MRPSRRYWCRHRNEVVPSSWQSGGPITLASDNPIIFADIDHHSRSVTPPHEVVGSMPGAVRPVNPKRLRQNTNGIRISVKRQQVIALHPGLVADMRTRSGEPPQTGKIALTTKRREAPHRPTIHLKLQRGTSVQPLTQAAFASVELQVCNTRHDLPSRHSRRQHPR